MKRNRMMTAVPVLALLAMATACDRAAEFRAAVPQRGQVEMKVPSADGQALTLGETSAFYLHTVAIAASVNVRVYLVAELVEAIMAHPPTTIEEDRAVWGPSEPRGLERMVYRFTVERIAEGEFSYALEARLKDASDEDFVEVFGGISKPEGEGRGEGTLVYHLDNLREIDADGACVSGDILVSYVGTDELRTLDVEFAEVTNECADEGPVSAHYTYAESADASGQMDFAVQADAHRADEEKPLEEVMSVRSRWTADGAGRSDVRVSEGEISADLAAFIPGTEADSVDLVECWDASFALVFGDTSPDELEPHLDHPATGDASACAFADASFAEL